MTQPNEKSDEQTPAPDDRLLPPEFNAPGMIQIRIAYNPNTNACLMLGPLDQKGICYAALECARDVVVKYQEQMRKARIMAPPPGFNGKGAVS